MNRTNKLYVMSEAELSALFGYATVKMSKGETDKEFFRKAELLAYANKLINKHISGEEPMNEGLIRYSRDLFAGLTGQSQEDFDYSFYNRVAVLICAAANSLADRYKEMGVYIKTEKSAICELIYDHLEGGKEIQEEYLEQAKRELEEKASPN